MTTEELAKLIKAANAAKLAEALAGLTEAERRTLAKTASGLIKAVRQAQREIMDGTGEMGKGIFPGPISNDNLRRIEAVAELAVLGVCGWTEAKRAPLNRWGERHRPSMERILRDRKPEWLGQWVAKELAIKEGECDWGMIRSLVKDGICAKPTTSQYIREMVLMDAGEWGHLWRNLQRDRGLLQDEVWRIFDTDFGKDTVLRAGDFDGKSKSSWGPVLVKLADSGELERGRLLTACLDALNRQQQPANASWFCKLHEALAPTLEERIARQEKYRDLLVNTVPAVVGFAVEALTEIASAGKLEAGKSVDGLAAALGVRQKGHALGAAKLLRLCAKQGCEGVRVATAAARGLEHPVVEVQEACLGILEETGIRGAEAAVAERAESVAATLRGRVTALLGRKQATPAEKPSGDSGEAALVAEARAIPETWRKLAGIDAVLNALQTGAPLPALAIEALAAPRLDAAERVTPIGTLDELIERLSAGVEKLEDAVELECILDGLSRLGADWPADFAERTAPLLKRTEDLIQDWGPTSPQLQLRLLARVWLQHKKMVLPATKKAGWTVFMAERMVALSERLYQKMAGPLLALPTHKGGWIDPRELVTRLRGWQKDRGGEMSDPYDLIQGLLRLAPEHRAEALVGAKTLTGEAGAAVRYALGGTEKAGATVGIWIAAARARAPLGEFPELAKKFGPVGADGDVPACYAWKLRKSQGLYSPTGRELVVSAQEAMPAETRVDCPTVLLHHQSEAFQVMGEVLEIRAQAQVWPANPEALFALGARLIEQRLNNAASTWSPTAPYLEPLFDQDTRLADMGRLALWMALLSKDAGARGLAVDAFIALINDGRCGGEELGATLAALEATPEVVRLNRVADVLAEVARVGVLPQQVAVNVMESFLAALQARQAEVPSDVHHLLTVLREWLTALGVGPRGETVAYLKKVTAGGKTGGLVKALLALPGKAVVNRTALVEALRGRVERARRWMAREEGGEL